MAYKVIRPPESAVQSLYVPAVVDGLGITMRKFFRNAFGRRKDTATLEYVGTPETTMPYPLRHRGLHRLTQREDGSPRCVACLCCSTACPAQCIFIEPGEYPEDDPRHGWERYPVRFVIDEMRCIFCGYCVEACPCDAIRMDSGLHAPPVVKRSDLIFEKERLLSMPGRDGKHLHKNPRPDPPDPESYSLHDGARPPLVDRGASGRDGAGT
ncbi:MAG: NADH-quinone oxidoreductase subunit I [Deltaproteobacteria bacterium]|nr:NADH-quinone oxidoreductase subunit I [Deltaproteobacteria bacterium]